MKKIPGILYFVLIFTSTRLAAQLNLNSTVQAENREQYIQKALQLRKEENYSGAIGELDSILVNTPKDAPVLLLRGDLLLQSHRFADAASMYKQLLPLHYESTIVQINLSYALFMNHQPAIALNFAKAAWQQNKANSNAVVNYFNALLWNVKTKEAAKFLKEQYYILNPEQRLVLKARLYTTSGNFIQGLKCYDSLVNGYSNKYYVQEYAEVLLAKKEMKQSELAMKKGANLFSSNEYKAYQQKLNAARVQDIGVETVYFKDIAQNTRIENSVWWQQHDDTRLRLRLSAGLSTLTSPEKDKIKSQFMQVALSEKWSKTWTGETDLHLQSVKPVNSKQFNGITGKQSIQYQPNDHHMLGLYYSSDILNFTASLLEKNIRINNIGYITNLMFSAKTGFYSQGSWGLLSDNNQRFLFFGSLYHLFRTEPMLKGGINFSSVHYQNNFGKNYFSPNSYLNTEIFSYYNTTIPGLNKFYLQLEGAAGMQKIEQQKWDPAFRFQTELGLHINNVETGLRYQVSNVASNIGTGYKFNSFSLKFTWKLDKAHHY